MAKVKAETLQPINILVSTGITVFLAEFVPILFLGAVILLQEKFFGKVSDPGSLFAKGSYTLTEAMTFQDFGLSLGILITVGILIYLSVMLSDEWFYTHKLHSLKNVALLAATWALSFFVVDVLLEGNFNLSTETLYAGPRLFITAMIFVIPFVIYFVRGYFKRR